MNSRDLPNHAQRQLDEALAGTFPAGDPPSQTTSTIATTPDARACQPEAETVEVFRVVPRDQSDAPFSSSANRSGGRWTSPGIPAVYASTTPAGAVLEFLAHMDGGKPAELVMVRARMPGRSVANATALPANWRETPHREDVREYGNAWVASGKSLALSLPSVLCEQARNLLINPGHEDMGQLVLDDIQPFTLDKRLL